MIKRNISVKMKKDLAKQVREFYKNNGNVDLAIFFALPSQVFSSHCDVCVDTESERIKMYDQGLEFVKTFPYVEGNEKLPLIELQKEMFK